METKPIDNARKSWGRPTADRIYGYAYTDHEKDNLGATEALHVAYRCYWKVWAPEPAVNYLDGSACPAVPARVELVSVQVRTIEGEYAAIVNDTPCGQRVWSYVTEELDNFIRSKIDDYRDGVLAAIGLD